MKTWMYWTLIALALIWSVWWFWFADCGLIIKISPTLRDIPVRCFHSI